MTSRKNNLSEFLDMDFPAFTKQFLTQNNYFPGNQEEYELDLGGGH